MKSGRIVVGKHVLFKHDNYKTKTSRLAVETLQTAELSLKMKNSCKNVGKIELLYYNKRLNHRVQNNKQYHRKVLLSSFHFNGHTLGFHPQIQKQEPLFTA